MILCGLIAALILYLFWQLLAVPLDFLATRLGDLPAWLIAVGALLTITLPASRMPFPRWCAMLGARHPLSHAPLAVAVLIGTAAIYWFDHTISGTIREGLAAIPELPPITWAPMLFAALAPPFSQPILNRKYKPAPQPAAPDAPRTDDLLDFDKLTAWLHDDREVTHPDEDLFGHKDVAARIAQRLINAEPKASPDADTTAVIGPLGSGKSTIRELTKYYLDHPDELPHNNNNARRNKPPLFVALSLWPYDSTNAAVTGILNELSRALGDHINTLPLRGIPDRYLEAIDSTAGAWGGLSRLLRRRDPPEAILKSIDAFAAAIGLRITLWIEDLERFAGSTPFHSASAPDHAEDELGPIRSLLYLLNKTQCITVIVADTSLQSRFDVEKIARYVEYCPRMPYARTAGILRAMREACLDQSRFPFIDPLPPTVRDQSDLTDSNFSWTEYFQQTSNKISSPSYAMHMVLATPRMIKQSLRQLHDAWKNLYGEIDFDEAMIASTIRAAHPDLFAFIDSNLGALRSGFKPSINLENKPKPELLPAHTDYERIISNDAQGLAKRAWSILMVHLFPDIAIRGQTPAITRIKNPQAMSGTGRTDYWNRFASALPIAPEQSDQATLRTIRAWSEGEENDLIDRLMDDDRANRFVQFKRRFQRANLTRLLTEMVHRLKDIPVNEWADDHAPGIASVWNICIESGLEENSLMPALKDLIRATAPTNLPLAHEIAYWFASTSSDVPTLMNNNVCIDVLNTLHQSLKEIAERNGAAGLERAINGGAPYIMNWATWGIDRIRENQLNRIPFDGWQHVANALLDLIDRNPSLAVQQIAPILVDSDRSDTTGIFTATVNDERARRLFEDGYDRLIQSLALIDDNETRGEQIDAMIRSLLRWAKDQQSSP